MNFRHKKLALRHELKPYFFKGITHIPWLSPCAP
jgi:hypothetical protein